MPRWTESQKDKIREAITALKHAESDHHQRRALVAELRLYRLIGVEP